MEYVDGDAYSHYCVAFPVRDSDELLYIEPQNDLPWYNVKAGAIPYQVFPDGSKWPLTTNPIVKVLVNK
jgi:hypothetical protein